MENANLVHKTEELINSTKILDAFEDHNLDNFLDLNNDVLYAYGKWDSKHILNNIDDEISLDDEYKKIEDALFPKESFNPKEYYLPIEYFSRTSVSTQIMKELSSLIKKENPKIKYLACAKSTGKTISQNVWLKENDKYLEEKKIFWRRCDCKKLIDLYKDSIERKTCNEKNIIKRYLDIQFLHVLCKHMDSEERPFFQQINKELSDYTFQPRISKNHKERKLGDSIPILTEMRNIKNTIFTYKKQFGRHYGREIVIKEAIGKEVQYTKNIDNWIRLSEHIQRILKAKGYKILNIIDSIDNYKKFEDNGDQTPFYSFILKQLSDYTFDYIDNKNNKEFVAILGRQNTYYDYWRELNLAKDRFNARNEIEEMFLNPNTIQDKRDIFKKRYDFLEKKFPNSKIVKMFRLIINYEINKYCPFYNFLISDKHVGYLIRNQYNLIPTIFYFQKKYQLEDNNIDAFLESQMPVNILLNGYFSLNTSLRSESEEKGKMLFNIFYYEKQGNVNNTWHGLCSTRIIQYLLNHGKVTKIDLIEEIYRLFKYDKNEIIEKLTKLANFALIKFENNKKDMNNPNVSITDKGKNMLDFVYSELDILYHCSLDTPLPHQLRLRKFIQPHENALEKRNYAISCLKSSISFIQYLKMINKKEIEHLKSLSLSKYELSAYTLPFYEKDVKDYLNKRISNLINSLKGGALEDFNNFIDEFKTEIITEI